MLEILWKKTDMNALMRPGHTKRHPLPSSRSTAKGFPSFAGSRKADLDALYSSEIVLFQQRRGLVSISVESGLHDGPMFVGDVRSGLRDVASHMPVTLKFVKKLVTKLQDALGLAGGQQGVMKRLVLPRPFVRISPEDVVFGSLDAQEPVPRDDKLLLPGCVAELDRLAQCKLVETNAGTMKIPQFLDRRRDNRKAAMVALRDQSFRGQSAQRFPDRGETNLKAAGKLSYVELRLRGKFPCDDLFSQFFIGAAGQGPLERGRVDVLVHMIGSLSFRLWRTEGLFIDKIHNFAAYLYENRKNPTMIEHFAHGEP